MKNRAKIVFYVPKANLSGVGTFLLEKSNYILDYFLIYICIKSP